VVVEVSPTHLKNNMRSVKTGIIFPSILVCKKLRKNLNETKLPTLHRKFPALLAPFVGRIPKNTYQKHQVFA